MIYNRKELRKSISNTLHLLWQERDELYMKEWDNETWLYSKMLSIAEETLSSILGATEDEVFKNEN